MTQLMTSGQSQEARYSTDRVMETSMHLGESNALGFSAAFDDMAGVWNDCKTPDWDGYGAQAVDLPTFENACRFLSSLPLGTMLPAAGAEPDGSLTFEWYRSADQILSVSINAQNQLHYAALLGRRRQYGTEWFHGSVPRTIQLLIREISAA